MAERIQANMTQSQPMIVGAGPVGLAAAVFIAKQGVIPRVVDAAPGRSEQSRALAVNPRTLAILEPTGVTTDMLRIGKPIRGVQISFGKKVAAKMSLDALPPPYPFMLALSQSVTARLLEEDFNRRGGRVEWNCELIQCRNIAGGVEADLKSASDGAVTTVQCPWLLAADGARSAVRKSLGIEFPGSSFEKPWYLADVPLFTPLAQDHAHVFFLRGGGFLFAIRVVDDKDAHRAGDPIWRLISTAPDMPDHFEFGRASGPAVWTSGFHISHRINRQLQQGAIYFAGDAAHLHSPIGARGMNLGIEDAFVFSELLKNGGLAQYESQRMNVDARVVKRVELVSRLARAESVASRMLRATLFPLMTRLPMARRRFMRLASGLDHPLPNFAPGVSAAPNPGAVPIPLHHPGPGHT
jgi:2-polyprenyl-6-methoxyphenol hydroxylase-like FAD-dependent oxidoreductase